MPPDIISLQVSNGLQDVKSEVSGNTSSDPSKQGICNNVGSCTFPFERLMYIQCFSVRSHLTSKRLFSIVSTAPLFRECFIMLQYHSLNNAYFHICPLFTTRSRADNTLAAT